MVGRMDQDQRGGDESSVVRKLLQLYLFEDPRDTYIVIIPSHRPIQFSLPLISNPTASS